MNNNKKKSVWCFENIGNIGEDKFNLKFILLLIRDLVVV